MIPKAPKPKTCTICKTSFFPARPMATCCGPMCALDSVRAAKEKKTKTAALVDRRETKVKLDKLKSRSQWAREAQTAFNAWVRARDAGKPCISCGRHHDGQYHAGHFLSVGARPELRYEPRNVHLQCAPCNTYLSGNVVLYRQALLKLYGPEVLDWLEGPHQPKHYTIDRLKAIKADYTGMTKALKAAA